MPLGKLVSIGYARRSAPQLVSKLREAGVDLLADVRLRPVSRGTPDFNLRRLSRRAEADGITYWHAAGLGNRNYKGDMGDVTILDDPRDLDVLAGHLEAGLTVALLCVEREVTRCHRREILDSMCGRLPGLEIELIP